MKEDEVKERKLSFKCCAPRDMSTCSDGDLRLSLATMKNAVINITVCMNRIERELKKRGATTSFFQAMKESEHPEIVELAMITK
ncbi:MAG: hypothetical protein ACFFDD_10830 [Promethearchaeota archaeon]